jgi:hypothetical protein
MPTSTDTFDVGERGLAEILRQRARVLQAQRQVKVETRLYAQMLAALDGTENVTIASAGRASGVTKGYATGLVHKLQRGILDPPDIDDEVEALHKDARRFARRAAVS